MSTFHCLRWSYTNKSFFCRLFFNEPLYFPFFIVLSTRFISPRLPPPSPPSSRHLLISPWWIMNNSLHFYHCWVMYEHIHLHTPDYQRYVYSWASTLGHTHFLLWCPRWPRVSLMCGHHPSPRQLINRPAHQSFVDGRTGPAWRAHDTSSHL